MSALKPSARCFQWGVMSVLKAVAGVFLQGEVPAAHLKSTGIGARHLSDIIS